MLVALGAFAGVLVLQDRANRRSEVADELLGLQVAVSRRDALIHDALSGPSHRRAAIRRSSERVQDMVDELRGESDTADVVTAVTRLQRGVDRQVELIARGDPRAALAYHELSLEPLATRLEDLARRVAREQRAAAADRATEANIQSGVMVVGALLLAGILMWRFGAARAALARTAELGAAARESERRFRLFADHAADGFFLVARGGQVVDVNKAACESLGYTRDELLRAKVFAFVTTSTPKSFDRFWHPDFRGPVSVEAVHRRKDGSTFPVEARVGLLEADGRQLVLALARDTSKRVEAQRELRFQAELLDQVDAAVVATDFDGVITHWNRGATKLLGWPVDEAVGRVVEDLGVLGPRAASTSQQVRSLVSRGERWDQELRLARRDGSRFDGYLTASPVKGDDGELLGIVGVVVDISERKEAASELAKRAEQQAAVAELGRLAITGGGIEELLARSVERVGEMLDAEYPCVMELISGGRQVVLLAGAADQRDEVGKLCVPVEPDNLPGYTLVRREPIVTPDFSRETRFRVPRTAATQNVRSGMSVAIEGRDGPFGLLSVHSTTLRTFSRDDVNFLSAVANVLSAAVTREREEQLEQQLQRARRLESVGQLAGGVAHDFNNVLAVILNFAEFAREEAGEGALRGDIEEIKRAAERAAELTHQLLVFSRREPVHTHVVDLNDALTATEGMLRRTIGEHIELCSEPGTGVWPTRAGGGQLEQVLVNLAVNARDAMPDGGRLTIRTENAVAPPADLERGRWIRLTVADTGVGMPEHVAAQAFDPFFTTKPKGQGTGLGLATVYGIVSQAGGDVTIESQPGQGTTVSIWLPAAEGTPEPVEEPVLEPGAPDGGEETILVVEDEDQVRALTSRILAEHGYNVIQASDGPAALAASAGHGESIHLLVTDVVMPSMSGADLAERLLEARPEMKVLYMSGYTGDVVLRHGPRDRDVAVLEKPFSATLLLRSVRESLESRVSL